MPKIQPATSDGQRFDQQAWQRYRPVVKLWMEKYPNSFEFKPTKLAPETVCARMRDAVRGYLTFNWTPNDIPHETLREVWVETSLIPNDDTVTLKARGLVKDQLDILDDATDLFTISNPSRLELISVLTLANNSRFNNKRINITNLHADLIPFINSNDINDNFPEVIVEIIERNHYKIL